MSETTKKKKRKETSQQKKEEEKAKKEEFVWQWSVEVMWKVVNGQWTVSHIYMVTIFLTNVKIPDDVLPVV